MVDNNQSEKEDNLYKKLQYKFPEMRPIKTAPSLGTINTLGLSVFWKANYDQETDTYTKYHAICALFIPLFYLGAYRVANASNGGWYFLGKEKLSNFTRNWNYGVLIVIAISIGSILYVNYLDSPGYRSNKLMLEADKKYQAGNIEDALKDYYSIIDDLTLVSQPAILAAENIFENDLIKQNENQFAKIWQNFGKRAKSNLPFPSKKDFIKYGDKYFSIYKDIDIKKANLILEVMTVNLTGDLIQAKKHLDFKLACFEKEPTFLPFAIEKASELEKGNDFKKCEEILTPLKTQLKDTEGARILGSIIYQKGLYTESYSLLKPYFDSRLVKFHEAEKRQQAVYKQVEKQALDLLNNNGAPADWYAKYEKASEKEKANMDDEFIYNFVSKSNLFIEANESLISQSNVINVAIQLGIALLNIAQESDVLEKTKRLEEAEKIFLSVQGAASDTDEYQLTYGEILFWLGKPKEGEQQFNNFLEKYKYDAASLAEIANEYRSIGDLSKARSLIEQAYNKSQKKEEKESFASNRASFPTDLDDEISWLEKTNKVDFYNQASILSCKGQKKKEEGDFKEAEKFYRQAIDIYEKIPDNTTKLNNMSLIVSKLFNISHKTIDLINSVALLKKTRDSSPKDTIVLNNYIDTLNKLYVIEEIDKDINVEKIKGRFSFEHIYFNAVNQEDMNEKTFKLTKNANFELMIPLCEQLTLLAPHSKSAHDTLYNLLFFKKDIKNINKVLDNILKNDFTDAEYKKDMAEYYSNKDSAKNLALTLNSLKQYDDIKIDQLNPDDPSDIILLCHMNAYQINKDFYGKANPDFTFAIAQLEKSFKNKPRRFVLNQLLNFYLFEGLNEIYQTNEIYKIDVDKFRSLKYSLAFTSYMLNKHPELKPILLANKNIVKCTEYIKILFNNFPATLNISGAMLLVNLNLDNEDITKKVLMNNIYLKPEIEINYKLYPLSIDSVLEKYFYLILQGDKNSAKEVVDAAILNGVPL
jgi:predicted Zn-dependent protease